jgi:hypothetical protein
MQRHQANSYGWDYWTPGILADLILQLYNVKYKSKTSVYIIFKQSKFTYHKPEKTYAKRDQVAIDAWKIEHKPIIEEALKDPNTVLLVTQAVLCTRNYGLSPSKSWPTK